MGRSGKKSQAPVQSELFGMTKGSESTAPVQEPAREKVRGILEQGPHTPPVQPSQSHLVVDSLEDVRKAERELGARLQWARIEVGRVPGPKLGDAGAPLAARAKAFVERCRVFREHMEPGR